MLGTDVTSSLSSDDDLTAAFAGAGVVRKDWCVAGVLVGVPNRRDLQSWDHPGVPGRASREAAFHRDPKGHPGPFLGLQVRTREGTVSRLEGRADQKNQGD